MLTRILFKSIVCLLVQETGDLRSISTFFKEEFKSCFLVTGFLVLEVGMGVV